MPLSSQARPGSGDLRATAPVVAGRERRLLAAARGAAAVTLAGTMFSPPLANVGAFVTLLCFALLPSARTRLGQVLAQPLGRAALLLWAALAVATLWSDAPPMERIRDWWDWRPLLLLVIGLAIFDDEVARRRALLAFIGAATVGAAYSFWAWAHGYATVPQGDAAPGHVMRNTVTQSIVLALACFFALALAARGHWLGRRVRFALGAAALALLANLVFVTSGRTGHLLLLILLLGAGLQLLDGWRRVAAIVAVPLLAALAVAVSPLLQTRFTMAVDELRAPLASEQMTSMGIRSVMWQVSWQMLRERPLLGYGMGGFGPAYEKAIERSSFTGWAATPTVDPHNQYLQVQLQAGVVGSAAFAWFLFCAFRHPGRLPYRAWARAMLAGWCAGSLASSLFTTFAEAHMLMLLLGILLAVPPDEATAPAPRPDG